MMEDLADFIALKVPRGKVVELGVGFNFKVALRLKNLGFRVLAVDWNEEAVKAAKKVGIEAVKDDLFNPRLEIYEGAVAIYSVRPNPEIVGPILQLGEKLGVPVFILPLSGDVMPRGMRLVNYRGLAVYTKVI